MVIVLCRIFMPDGRTRLLVEGPFNSPDVALASVADAVEGTRYEVAMTDLFETEPVADIVELIREHIENVLRAYSSGP